MTNLELRNQSSKLYFQRIADDAIRSKDETKLRNAVILLTGAALAHPGLSRTNAAATAANTTDRILRGLDSSTPAALEQLLRGLFQLLQQHI